MGQEERGESPSFKRGNCNKCDKDLSEIVRPPGPTYILPLKFRKRKGNRCALTPHISVETGNPSRGKNNSLELEARGDFFREGRGRK